TELFLLILLLCTAMGLVSPADAAMLKSGSMSGSIHGLPNSAVGARPPLTERCCQTNNRAPEVSQQRVSG
ncbi:MAG: hypothetical protein ACXV47_08855, partial [Halobacteriota archaeon]